MPRLERQVFVGLTILILAMGCRDGKHPELRRVKGRVVLLGEPVADAIVAFYNKDSPRAATGRTDEQGHFYLTTFEDNDGALPGEHTVVVTKTSAVDNGAPLSMDEAVTARPSKVQSRQLLPAKYASVATSPLRFTISDDGSDDLSIELSDAK